MTLGEHRVRTEFNPARDGTVDRIKQAAATLIDEIDAVGGAANETRRLKALAMTAAEEAAMWGVKAATAG